MADKDNANPIVYAQSTQPSGRGDAAQSDEWWRDTTLVESARHHSDNRSDSGYEGDDYDEEQSTHNVDVKSAATKATLQENGETTYESIDSQEVYDLIRSISDPEHPLTLEQLAVVNAGHIVIDEGDKEAHRSPHILLEFTPTIPHCSMATLIGLAIRVRLLRALPSRYKVDIRVRPGSHQSENAVNKQLNDKERVAAALENQHLLGVVSDCLATAGRRGLSEEDALRRADLLAAELGITA
jgi:metal-sulfur cluster biosynthetic enzyme